MRLLNRIRTYLNRSPAKGDRKDPIMPDPTPAAPAPAPDVTAHLSALADAVRQLTESQKTLVEQLKPASPATAAPPPDISGDPTGGVSPTALNAIDYSKLSPLQQITLGLRDTKPAAARAPASGAD